MFKIRRLHSEKTNALPSADDDDLKNKKGRKADLAFVSFAAFLFIVVSNVWEKRENSVSWSLSALIHESVSLIDRQPRRSRWHL